MLLWLLTLLFGRRGPAAGGLLLRRRLRRIGAATCLLAGGAMGCPAGQAQGVPQLLVNGKVVDLTVCQPLTELKSLTVANVNSDSVSVYLALADQRRGLGAKAFMSVKDFNALDIVAWLQSEKSVGDGTFHNINLDENGESFTKSKAYAGCRLCLIVASHKKKVQKTKQFNLQFCAPEPSR